eukprot:810807-Prymnesium_polylepis.1
MVTSYTTKDRFRLLTLLAETPLLDNANEAYGKTKEALKKIAALRKAARDLPENANTIVEDWEDDGLPAILAGVQDDKKEKVVDCAAFLKLYAIGGYDKFHTLFAKVEKTDVQAVQEGIMPFLRFFEHACETIAEVAPDFRLQGMGSINVDNADLGPDDPYDTFESDMKISFLVPLIGGED